MFGENCKNSAKRYSVQNRANRIKSGNKFNQRTQNDLRVRSITE